MGRDVTGVRGDLYKSPYAKVRAKVSADPDQEVNLKLTEETKEVKDCEVKECTSEVPRAQNTPEKQGVLAVKSTNFGSGKLDMNSAKTEDKKASSPIKSSSGETGLENLKIKTPQKPSEVTIDKQVCESPITVETPIRLNGSNSKSPTSAKKSLLSAPHLTKKHLDDDDNWSVTSSASVRTTRSKTTVPVAPTFIISGRLEKRKEYYARLEEKRKALEAEKQEYEARTKEEEEAALKQLRKNMKFRANPVPSFYYESPPPKKELKKLPTTRAISPKFGRRKSCSDARRSLPEEVTNGRPSLRHSISGHLHNAGSSPTTVPTRKDKLLSSTSKTMDRSKPVRETNPDIAVQS